MLILTLRTDNPQAEIGLYESNEKLAYEKWVAHRQLAETIHTKILDLLKTQDKQWSDIQAVVCYKGPGSFTGLRIGISVANALASSLDVPIESSTGDDWIEISIKKIATKSFTSPVMPVYGAEVHITQPRT